MSLMVSPISNVSFRSQVQEQAQQTQNIEEILSRPGAFSKPEETIKTEPAPKKHRVLKFIAGTLITAGVVAGALYGLRRGFPEIFKVTENIGSLKGMAKAKAYLTTGVAKGAEYVEKGADIVVRTATDGWDKLLKLARIRKAA